MGITYGDYLIDSGYHEITEEQEREMNEGYTTHNSLAAPPRRTQEDVLLDDALGLLHRFATEQTGWRSFFRRWYYSDEPLRNDAANIVRRAGCQRPMPEHCQLVGNGRP